MAGCCPGWAAWCAARRCHFSQRRCWAGCVRVSCCCALPDAHGRFACLWPHIWLCCCFAVEYQQFLDHRWDSRHPLLYIAVCYAIYGAGRLLGQPTLAVFVTTLLRMLALASALAYACVFVQRRRAPAWALALMTAAFGLLPVFPVMAVSSAKDTPFAAALLVLCLLCWELLE